MMQQDFMVKVEKRWCCFYYKMALIVPYAARYVVNKIIDADLSGLIDLFN